MAHEYHHSVWVSRNFKTVNFSLLEYLILEGRADNFAAMAYPDIDSPWINLFGVEKEKFVWNMIEDRLDMRDGEFNMKMAVGDDHVPFGSVYTIGYRIVQEFLNNHPELTLSEWTDLEPIELK